MTNMYKILKFDDGTAILYRNIHGDSPARVPWWEYVEEVKTMPYWADVEVRDEFARLLVQRMSTARVEEFKN